MENYSLCSSQTSSQESLQKPDISPGNNEELYMEQINIDRLRRELIPLFEKAIAQDDIQFINQHLAQCKQHLNCRESDCRLHHVDSNQARCWQISGTYCGGQTQGSFVDKFGNCKECTVFKDSCPSVVEELGEHFNNMVYLLNKQKQEIIRQKQKAELLNEELLTAIESLDSRNREIQEMMITDKLTGLNNRHHLLSFMEDELARCRRYRHPLVVMMMDLDKFKSFNDTYGHLAGDRLLTHVGTTLKKNIRQFDRAFRYGGEEFVVILPETDMTMAYVVAERIRKKIAEKSFQVTVKNTGTPQNATRTISIGMAVTNGSTTTEDLISQADTAMYQAKDQGGNLTCRLDGPLEKIQRK